MTEFVLDSVYAEGPPRVFRAREVSADRWVLVTVWSKQLLSETPTLTADLSACLSIAKKLHHPNVLSMINWGETEGSPYVVSEHPASASLSDAAIHSGSSVAIASITVQCLHALRAAVDTGYLPAELHASDVTVHPSGVVKVRLSPFDRIGRSLPPIEECLRGCIQSIAAELLKSQVEDKLREVLESMCGCGFKKPHDVEALLRSQPLRDFGYLEPREAK